MRVIRAVSRFSDLTGKALSYSVLVLTGLLVFAVLMRYVFNYPIDWIHETSLFIYGAVGVMIGGYTMHHRGHVRMDLFYNRWSPRGRAIVDCVTSILFFWVIVLLLVQGWEQFQWAWLTQQRTDSMWHPLLWPVKSTVVVGAVLLLLQGGAEFASNLYTAVTGRQVK